MSAVDPASDPKLDPQIQIFLKEVNKDPTPVWEKPGPEVRATLTALQAQTPIVLSLGPTRYREVVLTRSNSGLL